MQTEPRSGGPLASRSFLALPALTMEGPGGNPSGFLAHPPLTLTGPSLSVPVDDAGTFAFIAHAPPAGEDAGDVLAALLADEAALSAARAQALEDGAARHRELAELRLALATGEPPVDAPLRLLTLEAQADLCASKAEEAGAALDALQPRITEARERAARAEAVARLRNLADDATERFRLVCAAVLEAAEALSRVRAQIDAPYGEGASLRRQFVEGAEALAPGFRKGHEGHPNTAAIRSACIMLLRDVAAGDPSRLDGVRYRWGNAHHVPPPHGFDCLRDGVALPEHPETETVLRTLGILP